MMPLKAPFPYFGQKAKAAPLIWAALGRLDHYIEPFAGSLASLLCCPYLPQTVTVNDWDCSIINFWRAAKAAPLELAAACEGPVFELEVHAASRTHARQMEALRERYREDESFYDLGLAASFCVAMSASIASGFYKQNRSIVRLAGRGCGVHKVDWRGRLDLVFSALSSRLKFARITSGDWSRVCKDSVVSCKAFSDRRVGLFFDPPYKGAQSQFYAEDAIDFEAFEARMLELGRKPNCKVIVAGHEGDYALPGWRQTAWARGEGYTRLGENPQAQQRAQSEVLWFSPGCLDPDSAQLDLLGRLA